MVPMVEPCRHQPCESAILGHGETAGSLGTGSIPTLGKSTAQTLAGRGEGEPATSPPAASYFLSLQPCHKAMIMGSRTHLPSEEVQLAAWHSHQACPGLSIQAQSPWLRCLLWPPKQALLCRPPVLPDKRRFASLCELPQGQAHGVGLAAPQACQADHAAYWVKSAAGRRGHVPLHIRQPVFQVTRVAQPCMDPTLLSKSDHLHCCEHCKTLL